MTDPWEMVYLPTHDWLILIAHVGKYTLHGSYGVLFFTSPFCFLDEFGGWFVFFNFCGGMKKNWRLSEVNLLSLTSLFGLEIWGNYISIL